MKQYVQSDNLNTATDSQAQQNDIRATVSDHLTQILLLLGRLDAAHNVRNLPATLSLLLPLIQKLRELENDHPALPEMLKENLVIREKYTRVFSIPLSLRRDPSVNGIFDAVAKLVNSSVKKYCDEEKKMLALAIDSDLKTTDKTELLRQTLRNAGLMMGFCSADNKAYLQNINNWCEFELNILQ